MPPSSNSDVVKDRISGKVLTRCCHDSTSESIFATRTFLHDAGWLIGSRERKLLDHIFGCNILQLKKSQSPENNLLALTYVYIISARGHWSALNISVISMSGILMMSVGGCPVFLLLTVHRSSSKTTSHARALSPLVPTSSYFCVRQSVFTSVCVSISGSGVRVPGGSAGVGRAEE